MSTVPFVGEILFITCVSAIYIKSFVTRPSKSNPKRGISIVLEGLDGTGKSTVVLALADRLDAIAMITPPNSMRSYRAYFDRIGGAQREAYYMVGNFVAATEISNNVATGKHVVVDRFYASTRSYLLGRDLDRELPEKGAEEYNWPPELLRPTITFFLSLDENERLKRRAGRTEIEETAEESLLRGKRIIGSRINEAYRRFDCVEIDASGSVTTIVNNIISVLNTKQLL